MKLKAVARRSASDQVFDQLAGTILRGEMAAGQSLLSERHLAEALGVSRQVVGAGRPPPPPHAGFVEVRQGGSTTVLDFRRHGGLHLLAQLLLADGRLDLAVARSIVEARQIVGPEIAALAAQHHSPTLPTQHTPATPATQQHSAVPATQRSVVSAAQQRSDVPAAQGAAVPAAQGAAVPAGQGGAGGAVQQGPAAGLGERLRQILARLNGCADPVEKQRITLAFWEAVADGADSIVFRLMFNSLRLAYEPLLSAMAVVMQAEPSRAGDYGELVDAIEAGDAAAARLRAAEILAPSTAALLEAIARATADPDAA